VVELMEFTTLCLVLTGIVFGIIYYASSGRR
jgi:hypothetical protein